MSVVATTCVLMFAVEVVHAQPVASSDHIVRPPKPGLHILGPLELTSMGDSPRGWAIGASALLNLRLSRRWGLSTGAGWVTFPDPIRPAFATHHTIAPEITGKYLMARDSYAHAGQAFVTFGSIFNVPLDSPGLASVYWAPFVGMAGFNVVGPMTRHGVVGLPFEVRLGYRLALGNALPSLLDGLFVDVRAGVGFDLL